MTTLTEYLHERQIDQELQGLIHHTLRACESIANLLRDNPSNTQVTSTNSSGDNQQKLDLQANNLIKQQLIQHQCVFALSSEEEGEAILVNEAGNYVISFDPLDGSSNIDVNVSVGTIFSILPKHKDTQNSLLQAGNKQVVAGFVVYGMATTLVLAIKKEQSTQCILCYFDTKTQCWTIKQLDPSIPKEKQELSINASNYHQWPTHIQNYISACIASQNYSFRYVGSMVADINRIVHKGGIFLYPTNAKTKQGKLRLLYEANPMAMIIESCGGIASNGQQEIMDIIPQNIHETTGVLMGSKNEMQKIITNEPT